MGRSEAYKEIELRQLRSFSLAAAEGNFSSAAQALGLSVTTVWEQVRSLERRLGASLIKRKGRTLELTDQGKLLLELIQPHIGGLDSLERVFDSRSKDLPPKLNLAATPYLLAQHLPVVIQEFTAQHPNVRLKLLVDSRHQGLARMVETREADLGLLVMDWELPDSPHLTYEPLFEAELLLVTSTRHALARKASVTMADLVRYPIITMPPTGPTRRALDRLLRQHRLTDQVHLLMETGPYHLIFRYVALGQGVALLYLPISDQGTLPGIHLRVFAPDEPRVQIALVTRKHARFPEHVEEFRSLVLRSLANRSPK